MDSTTISLSRCLAVSLSRCLAVSLSVALLALSTLVNAAAVYPADNILQLNADQNEYLLGPHLYVLEDATCSLTFDNLLNQKDAFAPAHQDVPNFGKTNSAFWVRLRIENVSGKSQQWVLQHQDAMYQYLDFWLIDDNQQVSHISAGSMSPRTPFAMDVRGHAFELDIPTGKSLSLYIRGKTGYVNFMPLKLYMPDRFTEMQAKESIFHGIYIGVFFAMILYNIFVFNTIREASYAFYIAYLLSILVLQNILNGVLSAFVFPQHPNLNNALFVAAYESTGIFGCLFTYHFLKTAGRERIFITAVLCLLFLSSILWLLVDYVAWARMFTASAVIMTVGLLTIGVRHALKGDRSAVFYVGGFGWLLVGTLIFFVTTQGILPFNNYSYHAIEIGSAMEAIFLSLALVYRFKQLKDEKEQAQQLSALSQAEALVAKEQSLQHKQVALDTIQKYSIKLEAEVKARTTELIDTQQKLIASEKMAALGVFTAGMAHEINNPANFVSAGAQNTEHEVKKLQAFLDELLDENADHEIKTEFDGRFTRINDSINVIKTGVQRIEKVVKQLRTDHPEGDVGMQPTNVVAALESAWQVFSPTLKIPISLTQHLEHRPTVECAIAEIQQVFIALLRNAAHAIEDATTARSDSYEGKITLTSAQTDGHLLITISDNGAGIPTENLEKIFDPFFTTKVVGRGAGLGLSMARDVVKKHHGTLEVKSTVGEGSTFMLRLPLTQPE